MIIPEITRKIIPYRKLQAEKDQDETEKKRGKRSKTQEYTSINKRNVILKKKKKTPYLKYTHTQLSESLVSQAEHAETMNASRIVSLYEYFSFFSLKRILHF